MPRLLDVLAATLAAGLVVAVGVTCAAYAATAESRAVSESTVDAAPAAPPPVASSPAPESGGAVRLEPDAAWLAAVAGATGIPSRALEAYARAELALDAENPGCGLGWNTVAGLGAIESAHGTHDGGMLTADGYPEPAIRGIPLDGTASAAIADTDAGAWDGDAVWDRAVGPLQFIPDTWRAWGADGDGDGIADPNQIDDAALAAARYLCAGGPLTTPAAWRAAVFSYNHLDSYVDDIAAVANRYAEAASTLG